MPLPTPEQIWYQRHPLGLSLIPLGWLYCAVAGLRAHAYRRGWLAQARLDVPVILVGNLTVGGTGKTPLVLWLVTFLRQRGHRPGIVSRGYRAAATTAAADPVPVAADGDPAWYGDEPLLLARRSGVPVVVGRDRVAAARLLVRAFGCDCVVGDDGLQHYRLGRALEILLIDGQRELGNRRCLPAGPLREPPRRLHQAQLVLRNGLGDNTWPGLRVQPGAAVRLRDDCTRPLAAFAGRRVTAVAGIGHPERFFALLRGQGLAIDARTYPDHHPFALAECARWPPGPVLMTEKDAVKLRALLATAVGADLVAADLWYLPIAVVPEAGFVTRLEAALTRLQTDYPRFVPDPAARVGPSPRLPAASGPEVDDVAP
ncbi:MAG: tetraacyldisaccharide 4'-kinase [Chromatiaceae bacterium]|nr:MAG: tetraacyldisaccharide 4'-kinase [Chromatiaceae bacterium]